MIQYRVLRTCDSVLAVRFHTFVMLLVNSVHIEKLPLTLELVMHIKAHRTWLVNTSQSAGPAKLKIAILAIL